MLMMQPRDVKDRVETVEEGARWRAVSARDSSRTWVSTPPKWGSK